VPPYPPQISTLTDPLSPFTAEIYAKRERERAKKQGGKKL
jgi:hypothetical protein